MTKKCLECGKLYKKNYHLSKENWKKSKFCSRKCHNKFRQGKPSVSPNTTFKKGHKIFVPLENRRHGENNPRWRGGQVSKICLICSKKFKVDIYRKDTAKVCSRKCLNKYRALPENRIRLSEKQKKIFQDKVGKSYKISKSFDKLIRTSVHYKIWREEIFKRDNFICQVCGIKGGNLIADHIKQFALILFQNNIKILEEAFACEELWNIDNGRTLCHNCHLITETYGQKIN